MNTAEQFLPYVIDNRQPLCEAAPFPKRKCHPIHVFFFLSFKQNEAEVKATRLSRCPRGSHNKVICASSKLSFQGRPLNPNGHLSMAAAKKDLSCGTQQARDDKPRYTILCTVTRLGCQLNVSISDAVTETRANSASSKNPDQGQEGEDENGTFHCLELYLEGQL